MPAISFEKSQLHVAFFSRSTEFLIGKRGKDVPPIFKSDRSLYGCINDWSTFTLQHEVLREHRTSYKEFQQWLRENINNLPA